jgi:hypothetical protein
LIGQHHRAIAARAGHFGHPAREVALRERRVRTGTGADHDEQNDGESALEKLHRVARLSLIAGAEATRELRESRDGSLERHKHLWTLGSRPA